MGLEGLQSLQNLQILVPHSPPSCRKPVCARSYSLSSFRSVNKYSFAYSIDRPSTLFGSCGNLRRSGLKRSSSADSGGFFDEEFQEPMEDLAHVMDDTTCSAVSECNDGKNDIETIDSFVSFLPSKLEFLEPNLLGIQPEPPEWPERDEIVKMSIARKANSVGIPLSLRMIGRKQKWQEGFVDAGDFAYCSVKKAFSSMVFMIRELQNYALSVRGRLYSEDLQAVMKKFQKEMNDSFVWLFQQVFSRTPSLMLYVMLLLANFTVHSMAGSMTTSPYPSLHRKSSIATQQVNQEEVSGNERLSTSVENLDICSDETVDMTDEEEIELWNSVVLEASLLQQESTYSVLDKDTIKHLVSSFSVEIEPDDYVEFHRTDLVYQMGVAEDPNNPLFLSNYAQFLYVVRHDYNRAEECFKRAMMSGPPDAETLCRYADFLWLARNDLWNAEEVYQQALAVAPDSHYYLSKYAHFLWNTGGEDTCVPLSASYDKVM